MAGEFGVHVKLIPQIDKTEIQKAINGAVGTGSIRLKNVQIDSIKLSDQAQNTPITINSVKVKKIDADAAVSDLKAKVESIFGALQTDSVKLSIDDGKITAVYNRVKESTSSAAQSAGKMANGVKQTSSALTEASIKLKALNTQYKSTLTALNKNAGAYSANEPAVTAQYKKVVDLVNQTKQAIRSGNEAMAQSLISDLNVAYASFLKLSGEAKNQVSIMSSAQKTIDALKSTANSFDLVSGLDPAGLSEFKKILADAESKLSSMSSKTGDEFSSTANELQICIEKAKILGDSLEDSLNPPTTNLKSVETLLSRVQKYSKDNPRVLNDKMLGPRLQSIQEGLQGIVDSGTDVDGKFKSLDSSFASLKRQASGLGLEGTGALGKISDVLNRIGGSMILHQVWSEAAQVIRQMYEAVVQVDDAMTQLRIVTGSTDSQMSAFFQNAASSAKDLGSSVSDVLSSVETFSRLGYNLSESMDLSSAATIMSNVAATTIDESTAGITSIIKGFKLESSDAMRVADELVLVGQKYAVSASELMTALQSGGATLMAGNNTLEQSIALIAAGNASIQDASKVGNALKTTSMRIRGATAELEASGEDVDEFCESTAKMREQILALSGVDIMMPDGKTFKSTYDILLEIANVYDQISDINSAAVLEALAGKHNASVIQSVITNISDMTGAYQDAQNAAGTAADANAIYLDSVSGKIAQFKAQWQVFSNTTLDSGMFKGAIDAGTTLLDILTQIVDVLQTPPGAALAIGGGIAALIANSGNTKSYFAHHGCEPMAA